jgi:iron complex outermembrane receptor protein
MRNIIHKFSLLLLLLLAVYSTSAQSLLKGTVSGEDGNPLAGVNVLLHQNKTGTVSREDGTYQLPLPSNLKVLTLEYTIIGFRAQSKTIDLTKTPSDDIYTLDVTLVESPLELQEITVTAGFVKEKHAVPYPIETMMKKEMVSSGELTISRAIARTPGVYFSSFGLGGGQPIIRGLSNTNLVLLNNGIKQEVFQFSSNHPFLIDEFGSSQVEIIKGPASLQYGSDAVGGVINVVRERPARTNSIEGDFISQYHTNTGGYLNSLGVKGSLDKFFFGVRGSLKSHKDFSDGNNEVVNNTRLNENNLALHSGMRTGYGIFSVNYNYTDAKYGIQNGPQINLFANPLASSLLTEERKNEVWYQDLQNHLIASNNTVFLGKNTLNVDLGYQANTRELVAGGINPEDQLVQPTVVSMQLNTFTYNAKLNIPSGNNKLVLGVNGAIIDNDADESKPNIPMPDARINDIGLYAIGDFLLAEKFTLTTGLRYDYRNMESFPVPTENTDRFEVDNTYNNVNGSFGVTYKFSESQFLKANFARGFRSPTLPELTQNGVHAGRFERGDPDLSAQSNYQIDLTYHLHTSWATLNVAPFYNIVNNYIYVVMTNENAPIGNGQVFQHVQNDASLLGGEVALDVHPVSWLGIHGSYSLVRADITDDAEGIEHPTFIPQDRLTGEIKLQQEQFGFLKRPYLSVEVMNFFEQNRTGQNEAVTPAYTLLNAKVGTSIPVGKQDMDIFIIGHNLTNTAYIDHLSITKQLDLNMIGRNVMFGLRLPFGFQKEK